MNANIPRAIALFDVLISKAGDPDYTDVNYRYAGQTGHIHEVVEIGGRELAKVGFDDRKIVYYYLDDLDREEAAPKRTFHDLPEG